MAGFFLNIGTVPYEKCALCWDSANTLTTLRGHLVNNSTFIARCEIQYIAVF